MADAPVIKMDPALAERYARLYGNAPKRSFDVRIVGTITTDTMLINDFDMVHMCMDHMLGHDVDLRSENAVAKAFAACTIVITSLYPDFPTQQRPDDYVALTKMLFATYPDGIVLPFGRA